MPKTRRISVAAAAMFFVSGAIGLIYQVVWSRLFNQVFGVTTYAVTAVLTTYLGGLALGAWLLGPLADRAARPLRLYGWLELGAAVTALGGAVLLRTFDPFHVWANTRSSCLPTPCPESRISFAPVPSVAVPSLNVTVPVGVPEVAAFTIAVNVTACPKVDGFNEDTTAVDVACLFTTCDNTGEVLPVKAAFPPYTADRRLP